MMNEHDIPNINNASKDGSGFDVLANSERQDYRMLKDGQGISEEDRANLIAELNEWRRERHHPHNVNKPYPLATLATDLGISGSVLSDLLHGKYRGDAVGIMRRIDEFLAEERKRRGRHEFASCAMISFTQKLFGVVAFAVTHRTIGCIIAPSGSGKSVALRAAAKSRQAAVFVRVKDAPCDKRGLSAQICDAVPELRMLKSKPHRERADAITTFNRKRRNLVYFLDESQNLSASGMEFVRDMHDDGDDIGQRLPIILGGDENFFKLIARAKSGESSPIRPQLIRRLLPVFNASRDAALDDDGGFYTVGDIERIVQNSRIKLLTPEAARWMTMLANTPNYGMLGFAISVLKVAADLMTKTGRTQVDVGLLQQGLEMTAGPTYSVEIDSASGGELLRKATAG